MNKKEIIKLLDKEVNLMENVSELDYISNIQLKDAETILKEIKGIRDSLRKKEELLNKIIKTQKRFTVYELSQVSITGGKFIFPGGINNILAICNNVVISNNIIKGEAKINFISSPK